MHYLLQKLGRQIVVEQSDEPGKRQFLLEVKEICDVLENTTGTRSVIAISLDTSKIGKDDNVSVGKRAFEGMSNLRFLRIYEKLDFYAGIAMDLFIRNLDLGEVDEFLRIYESWLGGEAKLQIPENMEFSSRHRLFHWDSYPRKSLPPGFQPNRLVELHIPRSKLEKLWEGIERLPKLKSIDLSHSHCLKEIPNLLNATYLETLNLEYCLSLVELPPSIRNLHKPKNLEMEGCRELRVIPTNINLLSLEEVDMSGCSQLASFPDFSMNIRKLQVGGTKIEEIPSSIRNLHKLELLNMYNCQKLRVIPTNINLPSLEVFSVNGCSRLASFPDISSNITDLDLGNTKIKDVPPSIVSLSCLRWLDIGSRSLKRLTHVPLSVRVLHANGCLSLKRVCCSFPNETKKLSFYNCIQLDEESRKRIIQQSIQGEILLPGKEIPAEFTHKATGNSITIPLASGTFSASSRFKACILLSPIEKCLSLDISCHLRSKRDGTIHSVSTGAWLDSDMPSWSEHLFIFRGDLFPQQNRCHEVDVTISEITFEFSCRGDFLPDFSFNDFKTYLFSSFNGSETEGNYSDDSETKGCCDDKIIECGVEIMMEEAEGSSSSKVDNFETESSSSEVDYYESGGNNHHHTDGDGDEDNEAEPFLVSQGENIKTSTCCWSWLRIFVSREEDE